MIAKLHKWFDLNWAVVAQKSAAQGRPVTCGKGCFHCCDEPVYCDRTEAQYIIDSLSPLAIEELKPKVREWLSKARAGGALNHEQPQVVGYKKLLLWCPLLRDGLCSIYPHRPIACREHCAIGPPRLCGELNDSRLNQRYVLCPELNHAVFGELASRLNGLNLDHLMVWFAEILLGENLLHESAARTIVEVQSEAAK